MAGRSLELQSYVDFIKKESVMEDLENCGVESELEASLTSIEYKLNSIATAKYKIFLQEEVLKYKLHRTDDKVQCGEIFRIISEFGVADHIIKIDEELDEVGIDKLTSVVEELELGFDGRAVKELKTKLASYERNLKYMFVHLRKELIEILMNIVLDDKLTDQASFVRAAQLVIVNGERVNIIFDATKLSNTIKSLMAKLTSAFSLLMKDGIAVQVQEIN
jgi:hypothetical protein